MQLWVACRVRHHTDNVADDDVDDDVIEQYPNIGVAQCSESVMSHFIEHVTIRLRGDWVCACIVIGVALEGAER